MAPFIQWRLQVARARQWTVPEAYWKGCRMDLFETWCEEMQISDARLQEMLRGAWNAAVVEAIRMITEHGGRALANQLTVLLSPEQ
jgi:hypothetical protein